MRSGSVLGVRKDPFSGEYLSALARCPIQLAFSQTHQHNMFSVYSAFPPASSAIRPFNTICTHTRVHAFAQPIHIVLPFNASHVRHKYEDLQQLFVGRKQSHASTKNTRLLTKLLLTHTNIHIALYVKGDKKYKLEHYVLARNYCTLRTSK